MTDLQDITRRLLAAGHATSPGDNGIDLLDVNPTNSNLTYKRWTGNGFSDEELIAISVRPKSSAAYLSNSAKKLILCISSTSTLRAIGYDNNYREWIDDESGDQKVHPESNVAASFATDGLQHVFIQDPWKRLVHFDNVWMPTVLPANPVQGTPLSTLVVGGRVQLFYISANNNYVHYTTQQQNGSWSDTVFATYAFDSKQKPKRLFIMQNNSGVLECYVLTEDNALLMITADAKVTLLGTVNSAGQLVLSPVSSSAGGATGSTAGVDSGAGGTTGGDRYIPLPWGNAVISDPSNNTGYVQNAKGDTTIHLPWGDVFISP